MRSIPSKLFYALLYTAPIALLALAACGGGGGSSTPVTFLLGGVTSNLTNQGLVLGNSGVNPVEQLSVAGVVSGVTNFSFNRVPQGDSYGVSVLAHPSTPMHQRCSVTSNNSSSNSMLSDVTNIEVACVDVFTVGGTIYNLFGAGFTLQNNGVDDLPVSAPMAQFNTIPFTFQTPLLDGAGYDVSVSMQPNGQNCDFNPPDLASGVVATDNVTSVVIVCSP